LLISNISDPYAKVIIHDKKEIKTKIVKKTLNPKWDEVFHIDGVPEKGSFVIQLWDWDLIGTDDFLGSVEIPYSAAVYGKAKEKWVQLNDEEGPQGDVHFFIQVIPKGYKADLDSVSVSSSRLSTAPEVKDGSAQLVVEGIIICLW
jgi:Ca2+-dependent lipid-binding protein